MHYKKTKCITQTTSKNQQKIKTKNHKKSRIHDLSFFSKKRRLYFIKIQLLARPKVIKVTRLWQASETPEHKKTM